MSEKSTKVAEFNAWWEKRIRRRATAMIVLSILVLALAGGAVWWVDHRPSIWVRCEHGVECFEGATTNPRCRCVK